MRFLIVVAVILASQLARATVEPRIVNCKLTDNSGSFKDVQIEALRFDSPTIHEALENSVRSSTPVVTRGRLWLDQIGYVFGLSLETQYFGHEPNMYVSDGQVSALLPGQSVPDYKFHMTYDAWAKPVLQVTLTGPNIDASGTCTVVVGLP